MLVLVAFAFVSGIVTILSPCILPVLPIVLSGGVAGGKARPFGVIAGFVASFTVFTLTLSALVRALGIPADAMRIVAVVFIVLFGAVMIVPKLREGFELIVSRLASRRRNAAAGVSGNAAKRSGWAGFWGGSLVGLSLGLVWTPCVGPIMASVISLALTQRIDGGSVYITLAYTVGTAIPMFGVMFGGRALLTKVPALARNMGNIQKGFGVLMILVGLAIGLGWDRRFQSLVLEAFPNYGTGLTAIETVAPVRSALRARQPAGPPRMVGANTMVGPQENAAGLFTAAPEVPPENGLLGDYGLAPALLTRGSWFNTEGLSPASGQTAQGGSMPLTMEWLRNKVVLVDFWTYSCVNCVRTIPYLRAWYETYKNKGLVIVGVHTPEFEFEKNPANVARAIRDLGVVWPVVQDNDYAIWNSYANQYWPAHYFIDAKGRVRYFQFGEGEYEVAERVIQALLKEAGASVEGKIVSGPAQKIETQTPETYLGYDRTQGFLSAVDLVADMAAEYRPAGLPGNGDWNLEGRWTVTPQYIVPESSGSLQLGFRAKNVFLVVEPQTAGGRIEIKVDGLPGADTNDVKNGVLAPGESRMYQIVGLKRPGAHVLHLTVQGKLRLFAFTFG
jgi:cytochrome c biogenesis protein CcdA/thiol-disulfide isomerase/thioredoxin